jgi:hypothetical protein
MGIEPTSEAWEASILPLYDARSTYWPIIPKLRSKRFGIFAPAPVDCSPAFTHF